MDVLCNAKTEVEGDSLLLLINRATDQCYININIIYKNSLKAV